LKASDLALKNKQKDCSATSERHKWELFRATTESGWWIPRVSEVGLYCSWCPACSGHYSDYTKAHRCTTAYQVDWGFGLNSSSHHLLLIQQNTLSLSLVSHYISLSLSPSSLLWLSVQHISPFLSLASSKVTMCPHVWSVLLVAGF